MTAKTDIVSSNVNLAQYLLKLGILSTALDLLGLNNSDGYGHGTHVAGTAAGRSPGTSTTRGFNGIAPNANLIDVKVLNAPRRRSDQRRDRGHRLGDRKPNRAQHQGNESQPRRELD